MLPIVWQCIDALFRRAKLILLLTISTGILYAIKEISFPTYRAEAFIVVASLTSRGEMLPLIPKPLGIKAYDSFLRSDTIMAAVRGRLTQQGVIAEDKQPLLDDFKLDFTLAVEVLDQTTRPIEYSPIIRLQTKADSREMANAMADAWAAIATEYSTKIIGRPIVAAAEQLSRELTLRRTELEGVWDELAKEKALYDLDALRKEIELLQERIDLIEAEKEKAARDLEGERMRLRALQGGLATEKPYIILDRAPSDDVYWELKLKNDPAADSSDVEQKVMRSQEKNDVYVRMKVEEQLSLGLVASHEAKLAATQKQQDEAFNRLKELVKALGEHDVIQTRLKTQETISKAVYEEVGKTQGYGSVVAGLMTGQGDGGISTVGVNGLTESPVTAMQKGRFGRKGPVIATAILVFLLSVVVTLAYDVGWPLGSALLAARRPQPDKPA